MIIHEHSLSRCLCFDLARPYGQARFRVSLYAPSRKNNRCCTGAREETHGGGRIYVSATFLHPVAPYADGNAKWRLLYNLTGILITSGFFQTSPGLMRVDGCPLPANLDIAIWNMPSGIIDVNTIIPENFTSCLEHRFRRIGMSVNQVIAADHHQGASFCLGWFVGKQQEAGTRQPGNQGLRRIHHLFFFFAFIFSAVIYSRGFLKYLPRPDASVFGNCSAWGEAQPHPA